LFVFALASLLQLLFGESKMNKLSQSAQAVLDAFNGCHETTNRRIKLAAALRAAADQLGYCRAPGEFEHLYGRIVEVDDLLAIAAELDGSTTTSEND
jgi:hypothetical protein